MILLLLLLSYEMCRFLRFCMRPWMVLLNSKGERPCVLLEELSNAPTSIVSGFCQLCLGCLSLSVKLFLRSDSNSL